MSEQTNTPKARRLPPTTKEQEQRDFQGSTQHQLDDIKEVLAEQSDVLAEQSEILADQKKWQEKQELLQSDLLELYKSVKGFLTVLGWFERMAIFIGKIAIAGGLLWASFKFLVKETLHK